MENSINRLYSRQLERLPDVWAAMENELPLGWVFGGLLRRADAPFMRPEDKDLWVAIAVLESPTVLGPVPEARGAGEDPVEALWNLRQALIDIELASAKTST